MNKIFLLYFFSKEKQQSLNIMASFESCDRLVKQQVRLQFATRFKKLAGKADIKGRCCSVKGVSNLRKAILVFFLCFLNIVTDIKG